MVKFKFLSAPRRRPGGGRKPLSEDKRLSEKLWVRLTQEDSRRLYKLAEHEGITVTAVIRQAIREACSKKTL